MEEWVGKGGAGGFTFQGQVIKAVNSYETLEAEIDKAVNVFLLIK